MSDLEQRVCDRLAQRLDEMYAMLESHVEIPTGRDYADGLERYRAILISRLQRLGATVELRQGRPRPWWMRNVGRRPVWRPAEPPTGGVAMRPGDGASAPDHAEHDNDGREIVHPILVARRHLRPGQVRVLLAGHIDTVHDPLGAFQILKRSPDGRFAVGPGAVDMKGGIVCALFALEAMGHFAFDLNWTFVLNADEETGSFQSEQVLRELAREHDYGIATEPALLDGGLAVARMGSGQFLIEVHGVAAHAGREFDKGRSAVTKLGEILVALGRMADPGRGLIVNVGPIIGGEATNIVPDYAACWGNVRYETPEAGVRLGEMIDALGTTKSTSKSVPPRDDGCRVVVHRHWNRPAKPLTPEVEQFAQTVRGAAEDLGQQLPFSTTGGVCDGNILQDAGLPTLDTLGIRGGNLHRTDEFIEIDSLVERAQLLAVVMMRLARD